MKKCPYCAEKIQDDAVFCRYCNHEIIENPDQLLLEIQNEFENHTPSPIENPNVKKNQTLSKVKGCLITMIKGCLITILVFIIGFSIFMVAKNWMPSLTYAIRFRTVKTWTRPADGMVMSYIPAGDFQMGNNFVDGLRDYEPMHIVYLDAFWMDKTEVTNNMFARCVAVGECAPPVRYSCGISENCFRNPEFDEYPVVSIRWKDADAYCKWVGARLPTEAEWEKGARGTDGRLYPWGDDSFCGRANIGGILCRRSKYPPVGGSTSVSSYKTGASPYGLYDMAGNANEYISDWYSEDYYANSPSSNPLGPDIGEVHVTRGGSYKDFDPYFIRTYSRTWEDDHWMNENGFRCARSESP